MVEVFEVEVKNRVGCKNPRKAKAHTNLPMDKKGKSYFIKSVAPFNFSHHPFHHGFYDSDSTHNSTDADNGKGRAKRKQSVIEAVTDNILEYIVRCQQTRFSS